MDKHVRNSLIAFAAVVSIPIVVDVYMNIITRKDLKRIRADREMLNRNLNDTLDNIRNIKNDF